MSRHAVITGGGTGIGAAIAEDLFASGYRVSVIGRRREPLDTLCQRLGDGAFAVTADVGDAAAVEQAFNAIRAQQGAIDVLVNAAGAAPTAPFQKVNAAQWQQVLNVNLNGVFHCTQNALPDMIANGWGRVINIASTASLKGYAYVSAYCAAKHGVLGLTRALALELAAKGITVNAICPGYTDTDIIRSAVQGIVAKTGRSSQQALEHFTRTNPQGRLITPEEVAATVRWLADPAAAGINGQAIAVDGGETSA